MKVRGIIAKEYRERGRRIMENRFIVQWQDEFIRNTEIYTSLAYNAIISEDKTRFAHARFELQKAAILCEIALRLKRSSNGK
jgi:hypothetical protein